MRQCTDESSRSIKASRIVGNSMRSSFLLSQRSIHSLQSAKVRRSRARDSTVRFSFAGDSVDSYRPEHLDLLFVIKTWAILETNLDCVVDHAPEYLHVDLKRVDIVFKPSHELTQGLRQVGNFQHLP
jgi:hypothetical protein